MMVRINFSILFIIIFITYPLTAQSSFNWVEGKGHIDITKNVGYIKDENKTFKAEDIERLVDQNGLNFSNKPIFNFQSSADVFWYYFSLENNTTEELVLTLNQPVIAEIELFFKNPGGNWESKKIPEKSIWYEKDLKSHINGFKLPQNTAKYMVRLESRTTPITFKIWSEASFDRKKSETQNILSVIFGFMLFIVLYNFFLFLTSRRIEYLLYCLLIGGYILFSMVSTGYFHFIVIDTKMWEWYKWIPIVLQPLGMLYAIIFLQIKKYKTAYLVGIIHFFYFISYWIWNSYLTIPQIALTSQANAMVGMLIQVGLGVFVGRKGDKLGYYFAAAYLMMAIFGGLDISYINFGKPEYLFDINYMIIGFLLEVLILSYLLTKRIEWENKAIVKSKEEAQQKLLETTLENERIVKNQNNLLEKEVNQRTKELQNSIEELKNTQAQLIQSEKMASLGELTAGIAHEIQNPLNFVNNFSEVSTELIDEVLQEKDKALAERNEESINELLTDIKENLLKISQHGKRASNIVQGMLQHSRKSSGEKLLTDINALCDEYLRLAYNGVRASDKLFNPKTVTHFQSDLPMVKVVSQDLGRVILNLINNSLYAVKDKSKNNLKDYFPTVKISTHLTDKNCIKIEIEDNGTGIPNQIKDKIFQPFFTTKPSGKGTGLGLTLSYDIIKAHRGEIYVESSEGVGSKFTILVPLS